MSFSQSVTHTKLELSSINDKTLVGTVCFSWATWELFAAAAASLTPGALAPPFLCSLLHTPSSADISITQLPKLTADIQTWIHKTDKSSDDRKQSG